MADKVLFKGYVMKYMKAKETSSPEFQTEEHKFKAFIKNLQHWKGEKEVYVLYCERCN